MNCKTDIVESELWSSVNEHLMAAEFSGLEFLPKGCRALCLFSDSFSTQWEFAFSITIVSMPHRGDTGFRDRKE